MGFKISLDQKKQLKKIALKYGIIYLVVFGSAILDRQRPDSDFDIALLLKKETIGLKTFKGLFSELSSVFKGQNIDLRFLNEADPFFRYQVIKYGQLVYGNKQNYNYYRIYQNKIYIDNGKKFFPFLDKVLINNQKKLEKSVYA